MFSQFFIERPVLSNVIALVMMFLGGIALVVLPISQFPAITPPTVVVTAYFPGASAQTVIDKVALPIELQVNGVASMLYMQSSSTDNGHYTLTVSFQIGTSPDTAQVLVQNRVNAALAQLPAEVQTQGVVVEAKSTDILQLITLESSDPKYDGLFLNNFATLNLQNELTRIDGVGGVTVFGVGEYSMRVWLNPRQMQARSLVPSDIVSALSDQNTEVTAGQMGSPPAPGMQAFQLTVNANGQLDTVEEFEGIIVKSSTNNGGQITRLRDVARVELGSVSYTQFSQYNHRPTGGMAIYQRPGSNALDTAKKVRAKMEELSSAFPKGISYSIPLDNTVFVKESVNEVFKTLVEAGLLVLLVIVVFLQDWRATLVPATTVPVTIIGAFAGMAAMGFSINTLTLFAIVLSIGIVVDDAIVVVEGTAKHLELGKSPKEAAIAAMQELFGPIVAVTLVLMAVFLPAAFLPGIIGQMYRQFALVIAVTALISGINAMTLKPTQCALWLRTPDPHRVKNIFFRGFNRIYDFIEQRYVALISRMVRRSGLMTLLALGLVCLSLIGLARTPTGFLPSEDQGYVVVAVQLPDASSLDRSRSAMESLAAAIGQVPGVAETIVIGGSGSSPIDSSAALFNSGVIYAVLKPFEERRKDGDIAAIHEGIIRAAAQVQEANCLVMLPPPVPGLGISDGFQMQVELTDGTFDYDKLDRITQQIVAEANRQPSIKSALTPFRADVPQLSLKLNRRQAETYGVSIGEVFDALQTYLGSTYVNQFTKFGRTFDVYTQADAPFRMDADSIKKYTVINASGGMVPLGSLVSITPAHGPGVIQLYNLFPAASIIGSESRGYSSGDALKTMETVALRLLPQGMKYQWTALSYQEKLAGSSTILVFGLAIVLVYLLLAGQYESWILPLAVIFAIPLALLGTVAALRVTGIPNNLYVQIGLVMLIALSAKNAILVVEMARQHRHEGAEILTAAVEAARLRFRPIMMTSFTFILGVVPLILARGPGAVSRQDLGITAASGMLASTCLAVVFVPSFFVVLQRWQEKSAARPSPRPAAEAAA
ncbi:MAG: efflux RND transporter permease subunit [Chthoniobacterales bacterium]